MTRPRLLFFAFGSASFLAGCSTPPSAMDARHPASASAPDAFTDPARPTLRPDAHTLRTRKLLAQRNEQAKAAESEMPVDQANPGPSAPRTSPGPMKAMEGMDEMKGMEGHGKH